MIKTSSIILASPPDDSRAAAGYSCRVAHLAFELDAGGRLIRPKMPYIQKGSFMVICHNGADLPAINHGSLLTQILREYAARGFGGIIADFEGEYSQRATELIGFISNELERRRILFYVPESFGPYVSEKTRVIISSAISGGSFNQRIRDAGERFGMGRITLEAERNCENFLLPAHSGSGRRISLAELDQLFLDYLPTPFFSPELCTYYFTYRDREKLSHFVLFDNSGSMKKKISAAESLGVTETILVYPEIQDIIRDILF